MIKFKCPGCPAVYSVDRNRGWNKEQCPSCRSEFIIPGDEVETPQPPSSSRPRVNSLVTERIPAKLESKRIVAGVLAIFLGSLGVHKFVLGYTRAGLIQIVLTVCTFGLMKFVAIVEGIIYLTKTDAEFVKTYQVGKKEWF